MDTGEMAQCALQIEKLRADRSYGNILTLLCDLDNTPVTAEQLETTGIATVLYGLRRSCCHGGVKTAVRSLMSKWKRQCSNATQEGKRSVQSRDAELPVRDGGASMQERSRSGSMAVDADASAATQASAAQSTCPELSPVRTKCVQLLLGALGPESPDRHKAAELAAHIERHIHERHQSSQTKYKASVRSKVANLRNPKNSHLHQGLRSGSLTPGAFARMSAEDMACAELRRLREAYSSQGVSERQLPRGAEGLQTQKVRCRRCGGSDCRATQVSRGALFLPAWVRRGGPDHDAMTFVTCGGCGQQWYHSGWVCL
ncbi:transcription elongation factor A N-terminal and central domain-containing protein [Betta splendens]|uniref:Transcription elongation factor A N-terminal and central domain-containing protein n=1 Tax=Betta splendens TaxID=158456 RepID=A0A6P7LXD6_BETSP|nr:transcription elongation factor A N-terminal and central domain-containing protein [Betta splendens]